MSSSTQSDQPALESIVEKTSSTICILQSWKHQLFLFSCANTASCAPKHSNASSQCSPWPVVDKVQLHIHKWKYRLSLSCRNALLDHITQLSIKSSRLSIEMCYFWCFFNLNRFGHTVQCFPIDRDEALLVKYYQNYKWKLLSKMCTWVTPTHF